MTISNVNGISFQAANSGGSAATDSVSKSLQNQIANAQKQLQDLAANPEMTPEDKMKRRQEIQQEITALNQQLRQHQIDQRKEQQAKRAEKTETTANGMSKDSMQAMISAESAMKQAKVQGSVATKMEGRAGILKAEIKQDAARGGDVEKKQKELAEVEQKAQAADAAQLTTLAQANQEMEGAAQDDKAAKELCKNKFTVLAIYGIMAIRRYDHGRTNSYYAAIT